MKIYTQLLGILLTLGVLASITASIYYKVVGTLDWITFLLFFVALAMLSQYLLFTRIGREPSTMINNLLIVVICVLTFLVLAIFPTFILFKDYQSSVKLNSVQNWAIDTAAFEIEYTLNTKVIDNNVHYILKTKFLNKPYEIYSYEIVFKDKDNFMLDKKSIYEYVINIDKSIDSITGHTCEGVFKDFNLDKYNNSKSISMIVQLKRY